MRRSPPLLLASPVEVAERPPGFGSEASDHREPETTDRDSGQRDRADIRNDRKVEYDQGARERGQQRVGRAEAEPPLHQTTEREPDAGDPEQRGRQHDYEDGRDDRQEDQREAQQSGRPQRQQERCDPGGERDLGPVPPFQPLDRDPCSVGKQQEYSKREEHQTRAVAQGSSQRLPWTERHVSAERRRKWHALR